MQDNRLHGTIRKYTGEAKDWIFLVIIPKRDNSYDWKIILSIYKKENAIF